MLIGEGELISLSPTQNKKQHPIQSTYNTKLAQQDITHPSATTTHLFPLLNGTENVDFSVIVSPRQLLCIALNDDRSPLCHCGISPHRIGCNTRLDLPSCP